jgi:non-ribosomal peptide synthetase-like protein
MGDFCMVADGVWMGSGIEHAGYYTNSKRTFGSHVFVGNLAVISPITREVPSNTTIGNLTFCPAIPKGNCIYLGSPAFEMPKPVTSEEAADQFEQQPWYMDVARALHNVFKISIPRGLDQAFMWALVKCIYASCEGARLKLPGKLSCVEVWWWTPLIFVSFAIAYTLVPILLKWSLVGMYGVCWLFCCKSAKMHMMWSSWMWRDEIHYEVSQMITSRLNPFLAGTPFMGWFFQLCGARIGSRSLFMYGHSMSEHDLVTIGDNVICEGYLQAHSFEGRKYQLDEVKIGHNCTIGINSTVMRSSELENGVTVGDLSLVMKGDRLEAGLAYVGLPAQAIL